MNYEAVAENPFSSVELSSEQLVDAWNNLQEFLKEQKITFQQYLKDLREKGSQRVAETLEKVFTPVVNNLHIKNSPEFQVQLEESGSKHISHVSAILERTREFLGSVSQKVWESIVHITAPVLNILSKLATPVMLVGILLIAALGGSAVYLFLSQGAEAISASAVWNTFVESILGAMPLETIGQIGEQLRGIFGPGTAYLGMPTG